MTKVLGCRVALRMARQAWAATKFSIAGVSFFRKKVKRETARMEIATSRSSQVMAGEIEGRDEDPQGAFLPVPVNDEIVLAAASQDKLVKG